ncbi:MAG: helix-turn-helix transcriptional regulator [Gemmatimonas sp.]|jgi:AraC-like DNA-binding protein|uniref:helix-turn-helix domain-containing protein n=1 Tax=Gemmatimonas sp. TaxID=1962908 RepID=UPI0031C62CBD|nr:helix-turn-helix transcriptional regulator [Gemmatimonas sp.]
MPLSPLLRLPLPAALIAWSLPEALVAQVRNAVGRDSRLVAVQTGADVQTQLRASTSLCLIVPVLRDRFDPFWSEYIALRERFPNVPVIAVAVAGVSSMQAALRLSQLGVSDLLDANEGLRADEIRAALSKTYSDATAMRVWKLIEEAFARQESAFPDDLTTMMKRSLRYAHEHLPASKLAALMQMHERTLRKFCETRRLPSPQIIAGWARLLIAALYIEERGRTFVSIARLLGYPTVGALRKQITRYTNRSPKQLRDAGAMAVSLQLLCEALHTGSTQQPMNDERPRLVLLA